MEMPRAACRVPRAVWTKCRAAAAGELRWAVVCGCLFGSAVLFISSLTDRGATPALAASMVFGEAKLRMIAENVANFGNTGYRAKQLDTRGFQRALRVALDARGRDVHKPFLVESSPEVASDASGMLVVTPSERPFGNILFHDGTNMSIERQMSELNKTRMMYETAAAMLRGRMEGLRKAIRGSV